MGVSKEQDAQAKETLDLFALWVNGHSRGTAQIEEVKELNAEMIAIVAKSDAVCGLDQMRENMEDGTFFSTDRLSTVADAVAVLDDEPTQEILFNVYGNCATLLKQSMASNPDDTIICKASIGAKESADGMVAEEKRASWPIQMIANIQVVNACLQEDSGSATRTLFLKVIKNAAMSVKAFSVWSTAKNAEEPKKFANFQKYMSDIMTMEIPMEQENENARGFRANFLRHKGSRAKTAWEGKCKEKVDDREKYVVDSSNVYRSMQRGTKSQDEVWSAKLNVNAKGSTILTHASKSIMNEPFPLAKVMEAPDILREAACICSPAKP